MKHFILIMAILETFSFADMGEAYEPVNAPEGYVEETETYYVVPEWTGQKLAPGIGTVYGPTGKETYYDQPMWTLISWARDAGFDAETYPFWIREDGCKMLGKYVMVAANLNHFPRYSLVETSLGTGIVVDTGDFIYYDEGWSWIDVCTDWSNYNGE